LKGRWKNSLHKQSRLSYYGILVLDINHIGTH
jgi:hypothetical protein